MNKTKHLHYVPGDEFEVIDEGEEEDELVAAQDDSEDMLDAE